MWVQGIFEFLIFEFLNLNENKGKLILESEGIETNVWTCRVRRGKSVLILDTFSVPNDWPIETPPPYTIDHPTTPWKLPSYKFKNEYASKTFRNFYLLTTDRIEKDLCQKSR